MWSKFFCCHFNASSKNLGASGKATYSKLSANLTATFALRSTVGLADY